jgi:hypothetical protein
MALCLESAQPDMFHILGKVLALSILSYRTNPSHHRQTMQSGPSSCAGTSRYQTGVQDPLDYIRIEWTATPDTVR